MARGDMRQSGPESQFGSPAYDAVIQPANAAEQAVIADRWQQQVGFHLFGDKTAAARVFSNAYESTPSPTTVALMGLADARQQILDATDRRWEQPFPGVQLGPLTPVQASPNIVPGLGSVGLLAAQTHHAHQQNDRVTRRRFGRA